MAIDGHMPEWHPNEPAALARERALDQFIESIAKNDGRNGGLIL